jgi:hypothetical protein
MTNPQDVTTALGQLPAPILFQRSRFSFGLRVFFVIANSSFVIRRGNFSSETGFTKNVECGSRNAGNP